MYAFSPHPSTPPHIESFKAFTGACLHRPFNQVQFIYFLSNMFSSEIYFPTGEFYISRKNNSALLFLQNPSRQYFSHVIKFIITSDVSTSCASDTMH